MNKDLLSHDALLRGEVKLFGALHVAKISIYFIEMNVLYFSLIMFFIEYFVFLG